MRQPLSFRPLAGLGSGVGALALTQRLTPPPLSFAFFASRTLLRDRTEQADAFLPRSLLRAGRLAQRGISLRPARLGLIEGSGLGTVTPHQARRIGGVIRWPFGFWNGSWSSQPKPYSFLLIFALVWVFSFHLSPASFFQPHQAGASVESCAGHPVFGWAAHDSTDRRAAPC